MIRSNNWDAATKGQIPVQLGLNLGGKGKVNQPPDSSAPWIKRRGKVTRIVRPVVSTMHTLELSKDTSIPAYRSMAVPRNFWRYYT